MPGCEAGDCGVSCAGGCVCVATGSDCYCVCDPETTKSSGSSEWLEMDTVVSYDAKDLSLITLARVVESRHPGRTAIPSSNVDSRVTMKGDNMAFADLLQAMGLIVFEDPQAVAS
jgi:hypothetical protein